MTEARAKRWVVLALVVTVTAGTLDSLASGEGLPSAKLVGGALLVTVVLSLAAGPVPEVAGLFAALVVTTALFSVVPWERLAALTS